MCKRILRQRDNRHGAIVVGAAHALAALLLVGSHAAAASADAILVSDGRLVLTCVNPCSSPVQLRRPTVPFDPFDLTISSVLTEGGRTRRATASQRTVVTPTRFTGSGFTEVAGGVAENAFAITFDLLGPHYYRFTGSFDEVGDSESTELQASFAGGKCFVLPCDFAPRGVLPVGQQKLFISLVTESPHYARASYDVDLSMQPVPEPASIGLLAAGLTGAAAGRRWKRRKAHGA
jgi:PEP-CTERM motif-containing protein